MSRRYQRVIIAALAACGGSESAPQTPAPVTGNAAPVVDAAIAEPLPVVDARSELPEFCEAYRRNVHALLRCDKLPSATKDSVRESYAMIAAAWATGRVPADEESPVSLACKAAGEGVVLIADAEACPL